MKEGGGGDHLSVRWQLPNGTLETPIPRTRLIAWTKEPALFATDPDTPSQQLTFSLALGAPAGMTIDPATGVLSWTSTEEHGPGTFPVTVQVTDNGTPPLSASQSFKVTVTAAQREIRMTDTRLTADGRFSFTWSAQAGRSYQVQFKTHLTDPDWTNIEPPLSATGSTASMSDPLSGTTRFYRVVVKP